MSKPSDPAPGGMDADEFWDAIIAKIRESRGLAALTAADLDVATADNPPVPVLRERLGRLLDAVESCERAAEPTPGSRWFHPKGGGYYEVLCVATCSTNGPREGGERIVVYRSEAWGHLWCRELSEFLDGRFVPADEQGEPKK